MKSIIEKHIENLYSGWDALDNSWYEWDVEHDVLTMHYKWFELIGVNPATQKPDYDLWVSILHPEDRQMVLDKFQAFQQNMEDSFLMQYRVRKYDGSWIWLLHRGKVVMRDNDGNPTKIVGLQNDISHLKEMEQQMLNSQAELEYRLNFGTIINQIAEGFINLSLQNVDTAVEVALGKIGNMLGVDRSYIFLVDDDLATMTNTHEWCNKGIEPQKEVLTDLPLDAMPWWVENLRQNKIIDFFDVRDIPDIGETEREVLISQSILSILVVPVFKNERLLGFAGFDAVKERRKWTNTDILMLRSFASTLTNVLTFKETQSELERYKNNLQDVLAKKTFQLEEKEFLLVQKEKELKTVWNAVHNSANGILITDSDKNIIYYNKAFCNYSGYSEKELIGKKPSYLSSGATNRQNYNNLNSALLKGNTWKGQFINKRKDGTTYIEKNVITPIFDHNGNLINYIAIKQDITKEQRFALESQRNKQLRALGTLASGIAHDFNNILQIIQSYAELMAMPPENNRLNTQYLENIHSATQKGKKLIESILTFSRQDTKPLEQTDIAALTLKTLLTIQPVYKDRIIVIKSIHDCGKIPLNNIQYQQLLINLIDNAADAVTQNKRVMVSLSRKLFKWENDKYLANVIELTVTDFGYGMSKETMERLYEPFFTTKQVGEGTGLGMPMVKGVVDNHKGKIFVESAPNEGTKFSIYFPI